MRAKRRKNIESDLKIRTPEERKEEKQKGEE